MGTDQDLEYAEHGVCAFWACPWTHWPALPWPCGCCLLAHGGPLCPYSFHNFDVEESHQCSLDWLMLGPAAPPHQEAFRLCGSAIPPAFISARDHVWIFFHSDASSSGQAQGFRLSYIRGDVRQHPTPRRTLGDSWEPRQPPTSLFTIPSFQCRGDTCMGMWPPLRPKDLPTVGCLQHWTYNLSLEASAPP